MFELALCVNELDFDYLERKLPSFRESVCELGGIFNISRSLTNVYFLIATEVNEDKVKKVVVDFICCVIRESLKKNFVLEGLKVNCKDEMRKETLVEALVNFDRLSDDSCIKSKIRLTGEFYIYSFYMFRLGELREYWNQLIRVTNQSKAYLNNEDIYLNVIRYLIDGIDMGESATIEKVKDVYVTKTEKSNILCKIEDKKNLINYLIKSNPKKITIINIDNDALSFISQIFGSRIQQG